MWGIQFELQIERIKVPMINAQSMALIAASVLIFRISVTYIMEKVFNIISKKQHNSNAFQFAYFYHLAIIILCLPEISWNMFDLEIWIFSYICIGILRKAIYIIAIQRNFLLNGYSYNNQIIGLLTSSRCLAYILIPASITYVIWLNFAFLGVKFKVISLLCFPSLMLAIDSLFLLYISKATQKHLVYFYNQNINEMPPTYKLELYQNLITSSIKAWHFYNVAIICVKTIYTKIDYLDCLWFVSILCTFYNSASKFISTAAKYHSMKKLNKSLNKIFKKINSKSDQICIICMEPLLNCYQLNSCSHIFHYKCFLQWIQTKQQCPVCRVKINLNV